jgi:hypothetical protein
MVTRYVLTNFQENNANVAQLKEGAMVEVHCPDQDDDAIDSMLQYMYRGTYSLHPSDSMDVTSFTGEATAAAPNTSRSTQYIPPKKAMLAHARVSNIAIEYQLPELEQLAQEQFVAASEDADTLDPEEMLEIAAEVYGRTEWKDHGLRAEVVRMIMEHAEQYLNDNGFIHGVVEDDGLRDLAMDLPAHMTIRSQKEKHRHHEELNLVQGENRSLKERLETAQTAETIASKEREEKDKFHNTLMDQSRSNLHRVQGELQQVKNAKTVLEEEKCFQTNGLQELKAKYEKLIFTCAKFEANENARLSTVASLQTELSAANEELTAVKSAHASAKVVTLDLQESNRVLEQRLKGYEQSLQTVAPTPQAQLGQLNRSVELARGDASAMRTHCQQLQKQADRSDKRRRAAEADASVQKLVIKQLLELNEIESCRHCDEGFMYYLEREGPNGYMARCCDCTTRHWASDNGSL